jgi:DNA-binding transcriptional ArsR family regulator
MHPSSSLSSVTQDLFNAAADQAALLAAPARLKILVLLAQAPKAVEELAAATGESVANISQHLKKLKEGGLLLMQKSGLQRIYELADPRVGLWLETLFDIAEVTSPQFRDQQRQLAEEDEWVAADSEQVFQTLRERKAIVLDVRPSEEAAASPLGDAVTIPLLELRKRVHELRKDQVYWIVCRGRTCSQATEGVRYLRKKGIQAYRLKESPITLRYQRKNLSEFALKTESSKKGKKG